MLRHLHIRNLVLIDDVRLDLDSGMTALTGETGAGKSIVLDAMMLLTGCRATPSLIRAGADRASVEAVFDVSNHTPVEATLRELGLESEEPGELILRREILTSGRSRTSVNGRLVPGSQLAQVTANLLEINGQHEQQTLLDGGAQRDLFDAHGGLMALREELGGAYRAVLQARAQVESFSQEDREREQRADFIRFQVEELAALGLQPGELARLEAECRRLGHQEELLQKGGSAISLLSGGSDEPSALDLLGQSLRLAEEMVRHDPTLEAVKEAVAGAHACLADAGYDLQRYVSGLEADPERLNEMQARIEAIRKVLRKHGPTEQEAVDRLAEMQAELDRLENYGSEREAAARELQRLTGILSERARDLSDARARAAAGFVRPLETLLLEFSMPHARIEVQLRPLSAGVPLGVDATLCGPAGAEDVEILFSANAGEAVQPLRRVASGGELSRIMLALRTLSAERDQVPVLVFDEVDAGISGAAARRVAERLAALGERHQVLCVTHNPSIASAAHHHLLVTKEETGGRTVTTVAPIRGRARKGELARLLDGGQLSRKGMALAGELLRKAG